VWKEAAAEIDATIRSLGHDVYEITRRNHRVRVFQNYTPLDDPVTLRVAGNKSIVHRLLRERGLPTPTHVEFAWGSIDKATEFLERHDGLCVVKPACDTGAGHGVTTSVRSKLDLARATLTAAGYSRELLIERQIPGDNYRLLYLDGKLLDVVRRRPPTLLGNGRATVRKLVKRENARRLRQGIEASQFLLSLDRDVMLTLAQQGLTLRSVPVAGARIQLKTATNENTADENDSARHLLCDSQINSGRLAVATVGARLAAVDIITADPTSPLSGDNGVILEVNTTPGFYYHYHRCGSGCPVAVHVLKQLLTAGDDSTVMPAPPFFLPCSH
jgi:cyanophycin synthetase